MANLSIRLLGGFLVTLDDAPVDGFRTQKARALLAYLAAEPDRAHSRQMLAGLLWPQKLDPTARTYLRSALAELRRCLDDQERATPYILASNQTLQLNPNSPVHCDIHQFQHALEAASARSTPGTMTALASSVDQAQGRFLEGFALRGCVEFEEWQVVSSEAIERQMVSALSHLVRYHEEQNEILKALHYAWRQAELEPLSDIANRSLIRLLIKSGDNAAALQHFDRYHQLLSDVLGASPPQDREQLVKLVTSGQPLATRSKMHRLPEFSLPLKLPPFLPKRTETSSRTPFVARSDELARLQEQFQKASRGNGRVVFIVGDAGQGKTSLIRTFSRQAVLHHDAVIVAAGKCTSFQGVGDPYLPFREALAQLSGDFATAWEASELDRTQALRLWHHAPAVVDAMLTHGPDLIGSLVPVTELVERVSAMDACGEQAQSLVQLQQHPDVPGKGIAQQHALFEQYTRVLQAVSREVPLILILEDLHWGDLGSLALLFHLGQRINTCRMLVVGTFRPEDIAVGLHGSTHPLEEIIAEFGQRFGLNTIDLNQSNGKEFVDGYLNLEPNRLNTEFKETLLSVSGGHPLFTIELLHELRRRGSLRQDSDGYWHQAATLKPDALPPRVEATIGRRIQRLPQELSRLLEMAAVQGSEFCIDIVAQIADDPIIDTLRTFKELEQRHRLVVRLGRRTYGHRLLTFYAFDHALFREYVYGQIDQTSRVELHDAVGTALASLIGTESRNVSILGQLAWHFRQAERPEEAVGYTVQAGNAALRLYAYAEAAAHYQQGLQMLRHLPDEPEWQKIELQLLIGYGAVRYHVDGGAAPGLDLMWQRARHLSEKVGTLEQRFQVLRYEWEVYFQRGETDAALKQAEACLHIAEEIGDNLDDSHIALAATLYRRGEMVGAASHFDQALQFCRHRKITRLTLQNSESPLVNALVNSALVQWYLGYADSARARCERGIETARQLDHPFSFTFALIFATALYQRMAMAAETESFARQAIALSNQHQFALWNAVANLYCGWARVAQGELTDGLRQTKEGLAAIQAAGMEHIRFSAVLADVYLRCGQNEESLTLVEALLTRITDTNEREWEPEVLRLKGELLVLNGAADSVIEECFITAISVAMSQESRSLWLRSALSFARWLNRQDRASEAKHCLDEIYCWFGEGFDTPELATAIRLLNSEQWSVAWPCPRCHR